jgi:superfamily I DNA/RNA helicase
MILLPRPAAVRRRDASLVDVTLDPAQRAAIDLPLGRALLVLGEAGHGKTTVLLHRVARIWRSVNGHTGSRPAVSGTSAPQLRGVVLVPTEGLVRLLQPLLVRLGADIDVWTFDRFATKQARRAFRRLPRESESTPPSVMRFKRSPALRSVLAAIADRKPSRRARDELIHLFGDRLLVERVAREAALPAHVVEDVLERTRVQFERTTEDEWSHVIDRERLVPVDRRSIDEGTANEHAATIDVEDYPVLFEVDRMRGGSVKPRTFDLIAIDEAQELAPLELALIGRSVAPGGSLIVSGDADQHTDATSTFVGWEPTMRELGAPEHATTTLEIGYRCPPDVVAIARALRAGEPASTTCHVYADERALAREIGEGVAAILRRDRRASVAIICRRPLTARRLPALLHGIVPARVVFDGRFLPRGPVQVTIASEVKGLEFDYVVVPDADAREWPADDASRRAMYVAVTRARHQVVFACTGETSALLRREASTGQP